MEKVMEKQLDLLIRLSAVDGEIVALQGNLAAIPKAVDAKRAIFEEAEKKLETAKEERGAMAKEHRQAEGALDGHLDRIRKLNDQTNMVKTNKEYQTLLVEIESLKKEQDQYEERILELMEQAGVVEGLIREVEAEVTAAKTIFEEEEKKLRAEGEKLRAELEKVEEERKGIEASVDGESIYTYNKVRALRGDAVAEVRDELCLGCRVTVPPQQYADVITSSRIQTCSHCQRILYHRPAESSPAGEKE